MRFSILKFIFNTLKFIFSTLKLIFKTLEFIFWTLKIVHWNRFQVLRWGRPCAILIFERGNLRGTLLEVADVSGSHFRFQHSETSLQHSEMSFQHSEIENFENFYFLVFRFCWAIVHHHLWPWHVYSPRAGSRLAFYIFYIGTQSGAYLLKKSVNGLPIKIGSKSVKFPITVENKNWGVRMPSGCYQARAQLSNAPPNVA